MAFSKITKVATLAAMSVTYINAQQSTFADIGTNGEIDYSGFNMPNNMPMPNMGNMKDILGGMDMEELFNSLTPMMSMFMNGGANGSANTNGLGDFDPTATANGLGNLFKSEGVQDLTKNMMPQMLRNMNLPEHEIQKGLGVLESMKEDPSILEDSLQKLHDAKNSEEGKKVFGTLSEIVEQEVNELSEEQAFSDDAQDNMNHVINNIKQKALENKDKLQPAFEKLAEKLGGNPNLVNLEEALSKVDGVTSVAVDGIQKKLAEGLEKLNEEELEKESVEVAEGDDSEGHWAFGQA